ncbi:hypothetical protein DKX38_003649 [Salix brachista]|uniref:S-protein homolog n=1 Tax=Salix brachista TaxID=2182728 RepID=A0A5N5NTA1_9ROSI|nr:hypothetical protein DKX38_003649 [Salix brachista]
MDELHCVPLALLLLHAVLLTHLAQVFHLLSGAGTVEVEGKHEENPVLEVGEQNFKHWRFRTQWKHAFGWRRSRAQCSYDPYSYSLNFDDGFSHES